MTDILQDTKNRMNTGLDHLKHELKGIRAGRASPALLEPVVVEVYGTPMKLKDMATISVPEPRQLLVTPFDQKNNQACAKAIDKANLGVSASVEGKSIRVTFPELDQNRRKDLITQCHKKREDCKISIRNMRRDANETLKKQKSSGVLPEDDFKKLEKQIQELTDKCCKDADDIAATKEKEISTV
ncbi:MAG: frr [Chlamydiia bacterium]|nr:frr [Chlamydiia bacterium]